MSLEQFSTDELQAEVARRISSGAAAAPTAEQAWLALRRDDAQGRRIVEQFVCAAAGKDLPMSRTQVSMLLARLERGPITSLEALSELGIARCGARVWDLREDGHAIHTETVEVLNRFGAVCRIARYSLVPKGQQALPFPAPQALAA